MTVQVPKRTLVTMMNSLSSGVVPRRGLEYIAVGRRKETETFVSDMEDTACGGGAFRFISGRFGNGKSFMTQMIRNNAIDKGFVVMDADLSINRRLTGSHKEGLNTYRELVRNVAIRTRPDGGAMESILQQWVDSSEGDIRKELRSMTSDMATMPHYRDFIKVVEAYCQDYLSEKDEIPALDWLKGEYDLKSDARKAFGVSSIITDDNWYDIIKLWAELFVRFGYKGLIVFLDEAVVLYKLQNRVSRSNNYERLLTMFNDIMQGKASHLSMYICGTPEFIEDPNRGLYSYEALRSRLVGGRFENGYDNYLGPVINLRPLTNEEVFVLLRTIKELHEQRYEYDSGITDGMIGDYLSSVMSSCISQKMITPREITRDLISLLDTLHQHPELRFEDMIRGRRVDADDDPDDEVIEDLEI